MEKIWLKSYPAGVPAEIDINEYASMREVLEESCAKFGSRPAYSCMGRTITFAELDDMSAAFGAFLQGRGFNKGARVALMMPNILQYPVCLFGILRAGCTVVNVNPLYTARELEHQLNDSGAEMIVVVENFAHTVAEVLRQDADQAGDRHQHRRNAGLEGHSGRLRAAPRQENDSGVDDSRVDAAVGGATRGTRAARSSAFRSATTTSRSCSTRAARPASPRARCCCTGNIVANLLQAGAWVKPFLGDRAPHHHHAAAALSHLFAHRELPDVHDAGRRERADSNPRDIPGFVKEMGRYRFTAFTGVNTLFNALVNNAEFAQARFLRRCN